MDLATVKFIVGQVVYAKIKGFPPWPAIITHIPKNRNVARVQYFNSGQWNELSFQKLTPFHAGKNIVQKYMKKNHPFNKAFREMQAVMEKNKKTENKVEKEIPKIILRQLSPAEIKEIQSDLAKSKLTKIERKSRLRSGRFY